MKSFLFPFVVLIFGFLISCGSDESGISEIKSDDSLEVVADNSVGEVNIIEPVQDDEVVVLEQNGIKLTEIKAELSEATLSLNTNRFKEGKNALSFSVSEVSEYSISYLANNYQLNQFSSNAFDMEFLYGNNVFLAFLTDANSISIKSNKGCVLKNAVVGDMENMFDMDQPHLFYYLPLESGVNPILDFYIVNTSISPNGNKVKATINDAEFLLDKWAAYQIEGLKKPSNTIRIQLLDKNGELIDGPFNDSGERNFNLVNSAS